MSIANINNLNGVSTPLDPFGIMNTYSTPKQKGRKKMAKPQGKEMTNGTKTIKPTPKNPKGGAKKIGKEKGGKGPKQAC